MPQIDIAHGMVRVRGVGQTPQPGRRAMTMPATQYALRHMPGEKLQYHLVPHHDVLWLENPVVLVGKDQEF